MRLPPLERALKVLISIVQFLACGTCRRPSDLEWSMLRPSMHFGGMDKSDWWFVNLQKGRLSLHFRS